MLLIIWVFGPAMVGGPDVVQEPEELIDPVTHVALLTPGVDQAVTMLTSIVFGLFIVVGVSLQRALDREYRGGLLEVMAFAIFIASTILAFYFGYAARMQALEFAGYVDPLAFQWIHQTIGVMAVLVGIAGAASFFLASSLFLVERPPATSTAVPSAPAAPVPPQRVRARTVRRRQADDDQPGDKPIGSGGTK
jgi:hypothetical protein